jgi:hypothetical protein
MESAKIFKVFPKGGALAKISGGKVAFVCQYWPENKEEVIFFDASALKETSKGLQITEWSAKDASKEVERLLAEVSGVKWRKNYNINIYSNISVEVTEKADLSCYESKLINSLKIEGLNFSSFYDGTAGVSKKGAATDSELQLIKESIEKYSLLKEESSYFLCGKLEKLLSMEISLDEFHVKCQEEMSFIN